MPNPSANNNDKNNQSDDKEIEADNKEERFRGNSNEESTPLLYLTRKRSPPIAEEKIHAKCYIKSHRFSSLLTLDKATKIKNKLDNNNYIFIYAAQ